MTWSLVGSAGAVANGTTTSLTVSTGQSSTAGNLLICYVGAQLATTFTMSSGWTEVTTVTEGGTSVCAVAIFAYFNNPGGITSATVSPASSTSVAAQIVEYTCAGVAKVTAADRTGTSSGTIASPFNIATSATLTEAHELAVASMWAHFASNTTTTFTPGSGFTEAGNFHNATSATGHAAFDYELDTGSSVGSTVTDAATLSTTGTGGIAGCIATFAIPPADSDTGSGLDAGETIHVSDSDTGSGSESQVVYSAWWLVGAQGALATASATTTVTPSAGQSSTAGNMLVCVAACNVNTTLSMPAGWTRVISKSNTSSSPSTTAIFAYFNNPGAISSATVTAGASTSLAAQIAEYSCSAVAKVAAADQTGSTAVVIASPIAIATAGNLSNNNELAIAGIWAHFAAATTSTLSPGTGFTESAADNNGVSAAIHAAFDYALNTGASSGATLTDNEAFSTTGSGQVSGVIATFVSLAAVSDSDSFSGADSGSVNTGATPSDSDSFSGAENQSVSTGALNLSGIRFVQDVAEGGQPGTSSILTLTLGAGITTTQGNTLILYAHGASKGTHAIQVTDSKGNTWSVDQTGAPTLGNAASLCSAYLNTALVAGDTITITFSNANSSHAACVEFSGISPVTRLDQSGDFPTNSNAVTTVTASTSANSVQPQEMAFCVVVTGITETWTLTTADPDSGGTWVNINYSTYAGMASAYQLSAANTQFSCTWSESTGQAMDALIATYRGLADNETGTAAESSAFNIPVGTDSASGVEAATIRVADSDSFSGLDAAAAPPATLTAADTASGTDAAAFGSDRINSASTEKPARVGGPNPITFVQPVARGANSASSATTVLTVSAATATTAGNTLLMGVRLAFGAVVQGVIDSKGNSWRVDAGGTSTKANAAACSAYITTSLVAGDTITLTITSAQANTTVWVGEFAGINKTGPADRVGEQVYSGAQVTTAFAGTTQPASQAFELAFAVFAASAAVNWTVQAQDPITNGVWGTLSPSPSMVFCADEILSSFSDVSTSAVLSAAANVDTLVVTYRAGPFDSDAGAETDFGSLVRIPDTDIGLMTSAESQQGTNPSDADFGVFSEAPNVYFPSDSDSFSGDDEGPAPATGAIAIFDSDSFRCVAQVPGSGTPFDTETMIALQAEAALRGTGVPGQLDFGQFVDGNESVNQST